MTRREFLKIMFRSAALGGISLAVFKLNRNKQIDISCRNNSICSSCSISTDCKLPQALSYRKNRTGGVKT